MLEEACQANAVVSQMRFLANDHDVVFPPFLIHFDELLSMFLIVSRSYQTVAGANATSLHEGYADHS